MVKKEEQEAPPKTGSIVKFIMKSMKSRDETKHHQELKAVIDRFVLVKGKNSLDRIEM